MKVIPICPECRGRKGEYKTETIERPGQASNITVFIPCYYCAGTGYQDEEHDGFVPIIRWDK